MVHLLTTAQSHQQQQQLFTNFQQIQPTLQVNCCFTLTSGSHQLNAKGLWFRPRMDFQVFALVMLLLACVEQSLETCVVDSFTVKDDFDPKRVSTEVGLLQICISLRSHRNHQIVVEF